MKITYGYCKDCSDSIDIADIYVSVDTNDGLDLYHKNCYLDKLKFGGFDDRTLLRGREIKVGDVVYRRNSSDKKPDWLKTTVNRTYIELIKEFPNDYKDKQEIANEYLKILEINKSGYAGVLSNGNIVDRREHPEAIPIQENKLLGIPKPKILKP